MAAVEALGVSDEVRVPRILCIVLLHELVDDCLEKGWGMVRLCCEIWVDIHWFLMRGGRDLSLLDSDCRIEE